MQRIVISENVGGPEIDALRRQFDVVFEPDLWNSPAALREAVREADALMVRNQTPVDAALIASGRRLAVIGRLGVGLDNVDCAAASAAGVVVAYAPEQNSISVAELALGMMLSLARMLPAADRSAKSGAWDRKRFMNGIELYGKTLGIVGMGRIGFLTAMRARAFGMDIACFDPQVSPDAATVTEARARLMGLDELLATADFISCHVPETPATVNLFNHERFSRMKPTAYFVNTSRGKVVDEVALARALAERRLAGAAMDVRAIEPPDGPLSAADNLILAPHIGAFTVEGQGRVVASVCHDVTAVLQGRPARNFFNFATPRHQERPA
jgi:D-3-phosphoglycerate dehydrogenase / 2-oxoglutarate reductase